MRADAGFWIAWSKVSGIGAHRLRLLWEHFGDMEIAWHAPAAELSRAGIDQRTVQAAVAERPALLPAAEAERLVHSKAGFITIGDAEFPALLRTVDGGPAMLHVQGTVRSRLGKLDSRHGERLQAVPDRGTPHPSVIGGPQANQASYRH
jgi:DNA processing protein